jgi:oxalate---CoA ligase
MDWSALEILFPAIPRNSVRQRISRWVDDPPQAAYLSRLESAWMELWLQYRGSDALPDPNPYSIVDWPVVAHIEFLRKHIDKSAIRAGYTQAEESLAVDLPVDVATLNELYDVVERPPAVPTFDFMTNTAVDEGRERLLDAIAFDPALEDMPSTGVVSDSRSLAESALKV